MMHKKDAMEVCKRMTAILAVLVIFAIVPASSVLGEETASAERIFRSPRYHRGDTNIVKIQPIDDASWIWHPHDSGNIAVMIFEKNFEVKENEGTFDIDVSGDERFYLTLDGKFISRGPNRCDIPNWQYQTYKIAAKPGVHTLKAVVTRMGGYAPGAQLSYRGGFILKASGAFDDRLTTGKTKWSVSKYDGMKPYHDKTGCERWVDGMGTQVEVYGRGPFSAPGKDTTDAVVVRGPVGAASHKCYGGRAGGWMLYPSQLPDQIAESVRPGHIVAVTRDAPWRDKHTYTKEETAAPEVAVFEALRADGKRLVVSPNTKLQVAWNLGKYICAYPILKTEGGKGSRVAWTWNETTRDGRNGCKGNRQEIIGKYLLGFGDNFIPDGDSGEFSSPWFRCGLWCRLDIETKDEPLVLTELSMVETRYPLEMESSFECDDVSLEDIRRISTRTMQMCCHETLFDCPYYEQLMYPGDTRVQLLVISALSRDDRMIKRAIEIFDYGTRDDGSCPFNYPKRGPQEGFTYTLAYLAMFGDYAMNHNDKTWLKARLPGLRKSMAGCELYENNDGLVEKTPGWNFMDWTEQWQDSAVPNSDNGHALNSFNNLFWLLDMQSAAKTERALGNELQAQYWEQKAQRLKRQIIATFWNEERCLIADTPIRRDKDGKIAANTYSEHQQALAIITGCLAPNENEQCFKHLIEDKDLAKTTVFFSYYLFEAYFKMGRGDLFLRRLDLWRSYVRTGLTTLLERPNLDWARSDCHAWGAYPVWFMQTGLAGIKSDAPLFQKVRIEPCPGGLKHIKASHPHPEGMISVDFHFDNGKATGKIITPVPGIFVFGNQHKELIQGENIL